MASSTTNLDLVSPNQSNKEVTVNALADAASPAMLYGRRAVTTAGLTWGYYGGVISVSGTPTAVVNGTVTLAANATNYVEADTTTGAVSVNQTGFTSGKMRLYTVVTVSSTVSSYTDWRVLGGGSSAPVTSVNGQDGDVALDAADVGADPTGTAAAAISSHVGASDPHTQYQRESEKGVANGYAGLGSDGKVPAAQLPASATTGGTVTSVALTTPGLLFDVTSSPVTGAGTLAMSLKTQVKNTFLAGPTTGTDAAPTMRALVTADLPAQPFDLTAFYPGVPPASTRITRVPLARAVTFPVNFSGSIGIASVAATSSTVFDVRKNGASVGTITFAAGATTSTFTSSGAVNFAAGDYLSIIAPATPDATLADPGFVLAGTR